MSIPPSTINSKPSNDGSTEVVFANANLHFGSKSSPVNFAKEGRDYSKYSAHLAALGSYSTLEDLKRISELSNNIKHIENTEIVFLPICDCNNNLITLALFINEILIDTKKLPLIPLVIDNGSINGIPLEEFEMQRPKYYMI